MTLKIFEEPELSDQAKALAKRLADHWSDAESHPEDLTSWFKVFHDWPYRRVDITVIWDDFGGIPFADRLRIIQAAYRMRPRYRDMGVGLAVGLTDPNRLWGR